MQLSNIPVKFQKPFGADASGAYIRAIPVTTSSPDAASQSLGWPPATQTASGAGGTPPDGRDMNGLDNMLSAWAQWFSLGGLVQYDSVVQAAVGGYPKWSVVGSVTNPGTYWQSTAENNTTNPDTSGAGWIAWPPTSSTDWASPGAIGSTAPNSGHFTGLQSNGNFFCGGTVFAQVDLQINGVGFSQSFGQTGYQKLPSGLIIQWGRFFSSGGGTDTVTFPITFPNNCTVTTSASASNSSSQVNLSGGFGSFVCTTYQGGSLTGGIGVGWIAIGY